MKKIVICLIILNIISCNKKKVVIERTPKVIQTNEHISKKDSISGNEYIFYFVKEKSAAHFYCKLDSLVILKNGEKYSLNLLNKKKYIAEGLLAEGVYDLEDFNFDGVNDIMLYPHRDNYSVNSVQYFADYFLFNKKTNRYEDNPQLDSMPNLEICKKGKYITSNDDASYLKKYRWEGNSLKLVGDIQITELVEYEKYKIKVHDIEENKKKEYTSKEKDLSYFTCK